MVNFAVLHTQVLENDANAAKCEAQRVMKYKHSDQSSMLELLIFVCGKWTWAVPMGQRAGPDPGARSSRAFIADSNFFKI